LHVSNSYNAAAEIVPAVTVSNTAFVTSYTQNVTNTYKQNAVTLCVLYHHLLFTKMVETHKRKRTIL